MRVDKKEILKLELANTGKSYREIAKDIGVSRIAIYQSVRHYENRQNEYISLNLLRKLSDYLGKDLTWLASGDGKWN